MFRLLAAVVAALPVRCLVALAKALAFFVHRLVPRKWTRYHIAKENLRLAFPGEYTDAQLDQLIYDMWVHLFRMVAEMVQVPRKLRLYNVADIIQFRYRDETVRTLCTGRPCIMLCGHYGNWEIAVATFGMFGFPLGVVARDLDNPYLHDWFSRFRQHTGNRLISKKGGGDDMVASLEKRGHLALLGDQDAGNKGVFVPFFGREASTFKSIALMAMQFRAYICVGYAVRLKDDFENNRWVQYELGCEEVIDPLSFDGADTVRQITERYTAALERAIRRAPEQYFWVHRRWKSRPTERRRKAAA
jgi:KDO2-lipid IV(A) lauroyltransferase